MKKKKGMKWRLAATGIKKNSKIYTPYIFAGIGMTAVFYILLSLSGVDFYHDLQMSGGRTLQLILRLGVIVVGVFSLIMLFYTNSFLIRTRTKEFGLYNILGLGRREIAGIVAAEAVISGGISIVGGLLAGLLFAKLGELLLAKMVGADTDYSISIDLLSLVCTALTYVSIYIIVMLKSIIRIYRLNTIDLLKSENTGERPPKGSLIMAFIGLVILAVAYYMAVSITNPIKAVTFFFVAVIMVILATFILFIVGSVTFCRLMQKKKSYYYKTNHFVSLSTMSFRMRRNGAGLAQICILSTMVLVMIASSSCLYFGAENTMNEMYPRSFMNAIAFGKQATAEDRDNIKTHYRSLIKENFGDAAIELTNVVDMEFWENTAIIENNQLVFDSEKMYSYGLAEANEEAWDIYLVSIDAYNRYMGTNERLDDNEVICCEFDEPFPLAEVYGGEELGNYKIVRRVAGFFKPATVNNIGSKMVIFAVNELPFVNMGDSDSVSYRWEYNFDIEGKTDSELVDIYFTTMKQVYNNISAEEFDKICYYVNENKQYNKQEFYGMYGGLFFIGGMLSLVFITALVLMIYYKQISEGYEDQSRFGIMQKVGMTEGDIRRSINSQMKTVFYLPLVAAVLHLGFAFPMIYRCLKLFGIINFQPLLITAAISVVIFAILYTIVYRITSNCYYRLVK